MPSLTKQVGNHRVTIRTITQKRPSGLASIGWTANKLMLNIKIDDVKHELVGGIFIIDEKYAIHVASITGFIRQVNTARHRKYHKDTEGEAFIQLCKYIEMEIKRASTSSNP